MDNDSWAACPAHIGLTSDIILVVW
jgi:hypothetical protein